MAKAPSATSKPETAPTPAHVIESAEHEAFEAAVAVPEQRQQKPPEEKKTALALKSAVDKPGGFHVYIGPSILGVIQAGAVYKNDSAADKQAVEAAIEKIPLIKTLLVPGERLAADRVKVKTPGNALYVNYMKLVAAAKSL